MTITRQRFSEIHASLSMNEYMDMLDAAYQYAYDAEKDLDNLDITVFEGLTEYLADAEKEYAKTVGDDRQGKELSRVLRDALDAHKLIEDARSAIIGINKELKKLTR